MGLRFLVRGRRPDNAPVRLRVVRGVIRLQRKAAADFRTLRTIAGLTGKPRADQGVVVTLAALTPDLSPPSSLRTPGRDLRRLLALRVGEREPRDGQALAGLKVVQNHPEMSYQPLVGQA